MPSNLLLPLFPLEVVLFPGASLPLHIFEERYKTMIGEAIGRQSEFGVVLAKDDTMSRTGCTAIVEKVVRKLADGRLDIVTRGRRRFEVLFVDQEKAYLRGGVHFFEDESDPPPPESAAKLAHLFERILGFLSVPKKETREASAATSFQIAALMPLDNDLKQQLLALRSEKERVKILSEYLGKLLPRLERARRVEKASRGNGHG